MTDTNEKPTFENEHCKFWIDATQTAYAKQINPGYRVFICHMDTGYKCYILYEKDQPIYETQQIEGMGAHLDMLKLNKEM